MTDILRERCVVGGGLEEDCPNEVVVRFVVADRYGTISLGACERHRALVRERIEKHRTVASTVEERAP